MSEQLSGASEERRVTVGRFDDFKVTIRLSRSPVAMIHADAGRQVRRDVVGHQLLTDTISRGNRSEASSQGGSEGNQALEVAAVAGG